MNILLLSLPGQRFSSSFDARRSIDEPIGETTRFTYKQGEQEHWVEVQRCNGLNNLDRRVAALISGSDSKKKYDVVAASNRTELIWDGGLLSAIAAATETFSSSGTAWGILSCDGGICGHKFEISAFFSKDPDLTIDRQVRPIHGFSGSFIALNLRTINEKGAATFEDLNLNFTRNYQTISADSGFRAYFVPGLFPCFDAGKDKISREAMTRHEEKNAGSGEKSFAEGSSIELQKLLAVESEKTALISFVIRTVFRRPALLRRCLISIDYIVRNIGMKCEVVLATDCPKNVWEPELLKLRKEFPSMRIGVVTSNGRASHSRVRNLVEGINATTGDRVAIIDDDDFYSTDAVNMFRIVGNVHFSGTLLFDTKVIEEHWHQSQLGNWERKTIGEVAHLRSSRWYYTIAKHNSLPLCSVVHQGEFLRKAIDNYDFHYDLSEDFVLHALLFSDVRMPRIVCLEEVGAFQSHRFDGVPDNVSTTDDRTEWHADTAAGTRDLLFKSKIDFSRFEDYFSKAEKDIHLSPRTQLQNHGTVSRETAVTDDLLRTLAGYVNDRPVPIVGRKKPTLGYLLKRTVRQLRLKRKNARK